MQTRLFFIFFACVLTVLFAQIKDTESATHGDTAASYQVVDTYPFLNGKVIQLNLAVLSHYSYLLISEQEAVVIDPGRDVFTYLDIAKKENVQIKAILLTHSHADFVAGHLELAGRIPALVYVHSLSNVEYQHQPWKEGDTLNVGKMVLKLIATPGHTPDSACIYAYADAKAEMPDFVFTGDTLFVGSVGRPDLLEGQMSAANLASMMFDTWHGKLSKLNDSVKIFPAHGAGSLCGAHLSDQPYSTIGEQRKTNSYLQYTARNEFIAAILDGLPEAPQYFKHNAALNRKGPELIEWQAPLPQPLPTSMALADIAQYYVVDLRSATEYAAGHIPNSVNIGLRGRLETWVGIMVPWNANLVLTGAESELIEAIYRLHRVGYKAQIMPMNLWTAAQLPLSKNQPIQPNALHDLMKKGQAPMIVDVRLPNEWMALRIGTIVNLPLNHLAELSSKLSPDQPVVTVCNSAYRSSMAIGILERKGFTQVSSLEGGSEAWVNAGLPVYKVDQPGHAPASLPQKQITLPERLDAAGLQRLILDLPGTFDLVDIRPQAQYQDYHIPGSKNVDIAELIQNPAYLVGVGPLIIVDRDGSLAMIVAGILSQKTQRPIQALYGGLQEYWNKIEFPPTRLPKMGRQPPIPQVAPPVIPQSPQPPPTPSKKKSAGC